MEIAQKIDLFTLGKIYSLESRINYGVNKLHPNIVKIYIVAWVVIALIWILSLVNIIQLGIVGYFLLIIFSVLLIISTFSKGPSSGFQSSDEDEGGIYPFG